MRMEARLPSNGTLNRHLKVLNALLDLHDPRRGTVVVIVRRVVVLFPPGRRCVQHAWPTRPPPWHRAYHDSAGIAYHD